MKTAKFIICRVCALPKNAQLDSYWLAIKDLIETSSPTLSQQIKDVDPIAFNKLDQRMRNSIERYFNRAKFRPVPYGAFVSVGLLQREQNCSEPLLSNKIVLRSWCDWTEVPSFSNNEIVANDKVCWRTQSTYYRHQGIHYFFQCTEGQTELFSLGGFEELDQLLRFCSVPRSTEEIRLLAGNDWGFYSDMLLQLVELQLVVHSWLPNITGADYFKRMGLMGKAAKSDAYAICIRHADQGFVNPDLEEELEGYVAFAQANLQNPILNDLATFKQQFTKRYENRWQPLADVLDPNRGIGYAGLLDSASEDMAGLLSRVEDQPPLLPYDELSKFLLNGMLGGRSIDLKNFSAKKTVQAALPNTISVLLQPADEGEWLVEYMGGPSAVHLIGRFAKDEAINSFAQDLVALEQQANAHVKFFDIAYQTGERTDNINRRPQLYPLELTIGGWSTHPEQLQISDLFINVIGGELLIYSEKYQCRVIPRMASAYNILRSSHPLFRLLADLQYQGVHHHFLPDVAQLFPDLDYYPSVKFGKLLLSLAKWKVPTWARTAKEQLYEWLAETVPSRWVRVGRSDQYLCLDLASEVDRELLWDSLQRDKGLVYIVDWPTGEALGILASDGERFAHQLQFVLNHYEEVYKPITTFEKPKHCVKWPIGSQWLFMAIYASPNHHPAILRELIAPLLLKFEAQLENWFYILYADPEKHIRLRLKWRPEAEAKQKDELMRELGNWLDVQGIVNIIIKPYEPEWQRYGVKTMCLIESFFRLDSAQAIFAMELGENERLKICYSWIWEMIEEVLPDEQRRGFLERMATNFATEMRWGSKEFKTINHYWRSLEAPFTAAFSKGDMINVWHQISAQLEWEKQEQYLADLIHMHVNRRFPVHARFREAQLYQYLLLHAKRMSKLAEPVPIVLR